MTRPATRLGAWIIASLLLLAMGTSASAQAPSPAMTVQPDATQVPLPDLTMAPLVTLPPIVASGVADRDLPTDGYVLGDPAAPVTIEVFEDFQCPYCHRFTLLVEPALIETWVRPGLARLVFRDLPFLGEESRWAAVAARLAAQQDRFWPYHDLLYANLMGENVGSYTPDRLLLMGRMAGLDMEPFIEGLQVPTARELWSVIEAESREASTTLGVNATPTVFVDGVRVATPDLQSVSAAIQAALTARTPTSSPASAGPGPSVAAPPAT